MSETTSQAPRELTRDQLREIAREASRGHDHREMARTLVEAVVAPHVRPEEPSVAAQLTVSPSKIALPAFCGECVFFRAGEKVWGTCFRHAPARAPTSSRSHTGRR